MLSVAEEGRGGQQTLFPWAGFMDEEPVKPRGRSRKPQPATFSMFEWGLTLGQESEAESRWLGHIIAVGAGV